MDVIISINEMGIKQVDAELSPRTARVVLGFLEQIVPQLEELHLAAQTAQIAQAVPGKKKRHAHKN